MCDPIRLSDSIEAKFVQGVRKYDKEETWRNKGTREEKIPSRFYKSGGVFRVFSNTLKIAQFILFKNLK